MLKFSCLLWLLAFPAMAESLVATRIIRAQTVLSESDYTLVAAEIPGALSSGAAALGLEARVTLYPGRAIRAGDIGPPALIERNQIVPLIYRVGGLGIVTEGRALDRAAAGEMVRVMNLGSRSVVTGMVGDNGTILFGQSQ
jgi:flagella basal body P-ring formation protein FlgA